MHAPPVAEGEGDGGGGADAKLESEHSGEHPLQPAQVHLKHASGGVDVSTGTFLGGLLATNLTAHGKFSNGQCALHVAVDCLATAEQSLQAGHPAQLHFFDQLWEGRASS